MFFPNSDLMVTCVVPNNILSECMIVVYALLAWMGSLVQPWRPLSMVATVEWYERRGEGVLWGIRVSTICVGNASSSLWLVLQVETSATSGPQVIESHSAVDTICISGSQSIFVTTLNCTHHYADTAWFTLVMHWNKS